MAALFFASLAAAYLLVEVAAAITVWAHVSTRTPPVVAQHQRRGGGRRG